MAKTQNFQANQSQGPDWKSWFVDTEGAPSVSLGELLTTIEHLVLLASEQAKNPSISAQLAHFGTEPATDWDTLWASAERVADDPVQSRVITPPKDLDNALPEMHHRLEKISYLCDAIKTGLTQVTQHALETNVDRQRLLGIPEQQTGITQVRRYLSQTLGVAGTEASKRARRADLLEPSPARLGRSPSAPVLPLLARSFHAGRVPTANVDRLVRLIYDVRTYGQQTATDPELVHRVIEAVEPELVESAQTMNPAVFAKMCRRWLHTIASTIDQDGPEPAEVLSPRTEQRLWVTKRSDRGVDFGGTVFGLGAELLLTLDAAANQFAHATGGGIQQRLEFPEQPDSIPHPIRTALRVAFPTLDPNTVMVEDRHGNTLTAHHHTWFDTRKRTRRTLDVVVAALLAAVGLNAETNGLPRHRGSSTRILTLMDYQSLLATYRNHHNAPHRVPTVMAEQRVSQGQFLGPLSAAELRIASCEAELIPVVFGGRSEVLDIGRARRQFSLKQYQAVVARDRGCTVPGCTIPALWCQIHHCQPWSHGGSTAVDNAILVCAAHHADLHHGTWRFVALDHHGAWFIPAPWVNPDSTPQRNRYWKH
ncbi:HNH endonuclease signature motif containing protein [Auritidibacter ignavus]|uniref:HNH endonuclease signature motif containing protein n=1 Tax=Auritidibacter TaxID=1160973 RepID=UPI000D73A3CB|nr:MULTISPECIES: HNH endonuclease signature motif containing protein [Auritidibacter]AXR72956.1 HNH endonuclease [Auritidibacter sp. NML130574]WGH81485.1 HNH endonuclease signature motif containing protein [Auritidibacter ignavus]WGH85219.1 HNH endonuclease signature motif containing protein [Auritidibacter ignavus]WGH87507.1 HNH endonuclease signature motif containing protein [Auritidibacter ignavus]